MDHEARTKDGAPFEPTEGKVPFPVDRWPSQEEADLYGYGTIKDWYLDVRRGKQKLDPERWREYEVGFQELQQRTPLSAGTEDDVAMVRESMACTKEAERLASVWAPGASFGTAELGPSLVKPREFMDIGPRADRRMQNHAELKQALAEAVCGLREGSHHRPAEGAKSPPRSRNGPVQTEPTQSSRLLQGIATSNRSINKASKGYSEGVSDGSGGSCEGLSAEPGRRSNGEVGLCSRSDVVCCSYVYDGDTVGVVHQEESGLDMEETCL